MPLSKLPGGMPDAAEFGLLLAYLVQRQPEGTNPGQWNRKIAGVIGQPGEKTRQEMLDALRAWMKTWASEG